MHARRTRRWLGVTALVLLAAGFGLPSAHAEPTGADPAKPDLDRSEPGQPDERPTSVTADALDRALRSRTADLFAGIEVASPDRLVVHAVDDGSGRTQAVIDGELRALGDRALPSDHVEVRDAAVSLASLDRRRDVLTGNVDALRQRGTDLVYWGPSVSANTLDVGVHRLDDADRAAIAELVGKEALAVTESAPNQDASRTTDSSPWYGGDLLSPTAGGGTCTSGFSVQDGSGIRYNTTAGHCGSGTFKQNGQGYGITISYNYCNGCNGDDQTVSTYPGSSAGWVFTSASGATKVGSYALGTYVGDVICTDGYNTGEACGVKVDLTNICGTFGGSTQCELDTMHSLSFSTIIQPGDSGGPLYDYRPDGRLNARGMQKATHGCSGPCAYGYFVPIDRILARHGVSILTVP